MYIWFWCSLSHIFFIFLPIFLHFLYIISLSAEFFPLSPDTFSFRYTFSMKIAIFTRAQAAMKKKTADIFVISFENHLQTSIFAFYSIRFYDFSLVLSFNFSAIRYIRYFLLYCHFSNIITPKPLKCSLLSELTSLADATFQHWTPVNLHRTYWYYNEHVEREREREKETSTCGNTVRCSNLKTLK